MFIITKRTSTLSKSFSSVPFMCREYWNATKLPSGASYRPGRGGEKFDAERSLITELKLPANKVVSIDIRY